MVLSLLRSQLVKAQKDGGRLELQDGMEADGQLPDPSSRYFHSRVDLDLGDWGMKCELV